MFFDENIKTTPNTEAISVFNNFINFIFLWHKHTIPHKDVIELKPSKCRYTNTGVSFLELSYKIKHFEIRIMYFGPNYTSNFRIKIKVRNTNNYSTKYIPCIDAEQAFTELNSIIESLVVAGDYKMEPILVHVTSVDSRVITFSNNFKLYSLHEQDCCEEHYLDLSDLSLKDFEGLKFNLFSKYFVIPVTGYGIRLKPINGYPVSIPGYGSQNGYYSDNLYLVIEDASGNIVLNRAIHDCQDYTPCD